MPSLIPLKSIELALRNSKPVEIIEGGPADTKLMRNAYSNSIAQWQADVRAIARVLVIHNPSLDTHFYAACGYDLSSDSQGARTIIKDCVFNPPSPDNSIYYTGDDILRINP